MKGKNRRLGLGRSRCLWVNAMCIVGETSIWDLRRFVPVCMSRHQGKQVFSHSLSLGQCKDESHPTTRCRSVSRCSQAPTAALLHLSASDCSSKHLSLWLHVRGKSWAQQ